MPGREGITDRKRLLIQGGLFALVCVTAVVLRTIVSVDDLDDGVALAANVGALVLMLVAAALSLLLLRSARRLSARAALAFFAGIVGVTAAFVWLSYPDASVELASLVAPVPPTTSPNLTLGPTGRDVRLSGDIHEGAAQQLATLLNTHPSIERIALTSEGGDADEGEALAAVIAAHHLTTYVPDFCVSACTLAFVGGVQRLLMDGARLGFHAPYFEGMFGQTFVGDPKVQRAAYLAAGLSPAFVAQALEVAPDDMWFPTDKELLAAHVATGFVDRYRFPDSILDGVATQGGARAKILENFPALETGASPQAVASLTAWYLDAYRRGVSEGDAVDGLERKVRAALALGRTATHQVVTLIAPAR